MKNVKIGIATLLLALSANMAWSQETKTPEERAAHQTEQLAEKLVLTPGQKEKIGQINLAIIQKNEAVLHDANMSQDVKDHSLAGNENARRQMIRAELTPDQAQKFDEIIENSSRGNKGVEVKQNPKFQNLQKAPVEQKQQ